jgi:hypothetical protein
MPVWSKDGRRLYFLQDRLLAVATVGAGLPLVVGQPHTIEGTEVISAGVTTRQTMSWTVARSYDIAADGRILSAQNPQLGNDALPSIRLIQHFDEDIRRHAAPPKP